MCCVPGNRWFRVLRLAAMPLACALVFVAMQVLVHGEPLLSRYVKEFIPWAIGLFIVQYLALRQGFVHRAALAVFALGICTLPYLHTFRGDASRVGLSAGISIANPNDLGAWFGFCCVYFAVVGIETRRHWLRAVSWSLGVGCLVVMGLTVSRAPVLAAACSVVFAFRRTLKRGFVPVFVFIVMAWAAASIGLFDQAATRLAERAFQDTGRLTVWPLALQRIAASALTGVGAADVATVRGTTGTFVTPHNAFIFIGLSAGVIPLLFFVGYWWQSLARVMRISANRHPDAGFLSALLLSLLPDHHESERAVHVSVANDRSGKHRGDGLSLYGR